MALPAAAIVGRALANPSVLREAIKWMRGQNSLSGRTFKPEAATQQAQAPKHRKGAGGRKGRGGGPPPPAGSRGTLPKSGRDMIGLRPQAPGRTIGGSATFRIQLGQIYATISSDANGKVSRAIALDTDTFSKCAAFAGLYDQVRLRSFDFTWKPMLGYTATGQIVAYYDYRGADLPATTLAAASMMQDAVTRRVADELHISWRKQSNVDDEFVSSATGTNFNSKMLHKLVIVVEGAAQSEVLAQAVITGVLEFTGLHD